MKGAKGIFRYIYFQIFFEEGLFEQRLIRDNFDQEDFSSRPGREEREEGRKESLLSVLMNLNSRSLSHEQNSY